MPKNGGIGVKYNSSTYHFHCAIKPFIIDRESAAFRAWMDYHSPKCRRNYEGSAKAMENKGAVVLFSRSIEKYKLR